MAGGIGTVRASSLDGSFFMLETASARAFGFEADMWYESGHHVDSAGRHMALSEPCSIYDADDDAHVDVYIAWWPFEETDPTARAFPLAS